MEQNRDSSSSLGKRLHTCIKRNDFQRLSTEARCVNGERREVLRIKLEALQFKSLEVALIMLKAGGDRREMRH